MKTHLPSLRALQSSDDQPLREELSLLAVREQVAVVRAFADEVERLTFGGRMCGPYEQLVEELARLGCRILETAATASRTVEPPTPRDTGLTRLDRGARQHSPRTTDRESGMWVVATPSREVSR
jgi:hypothetical protein